METNEPISIKYQHAKQQEHLIKATLKLVNTLIDQTNDQGKMIIDMDEQTSRSQSKQDRQIAKLKDEMLQQKVCTGMIILVLFVEILGNVLGAW